MKKGDVAWGAIIKIILVIVGFMVIMAVVTMFYKEIPDKQSAAACRATNVARGTVRVDTGIGPLKLQQSAVPSACKTFDVEATGTKRTVLLQLSDYITDCWWQWANGAYDHLICEEKGIDIDQCTESHCFTCYDVKIKELYDIDTGQSITITGEDLVEFMRDEVKYWEDPETGKVVDQDTEGASKVTYLDYIQYDERGLLFFYDSLEDGQDFIFEPNSFYSIAYFEPHENDINFGSLGAAGAGAAVGVFICAPSLVGMPACGLIGGTIGGVVWDRLIPSDLTDGVNKVIRWTGIGGSDSTADKLKLKGIYIEKETGSSGPRSNSGSSKACKVKYGYEGG